ncbi:hypothetical protein WN55_11222 [Dufourea novaeangliae]|uniref:Uncharacterized protein n=1 Tax=Dufourea novaeangliae TaxID=178035 RepID=A0A154PBK8_DUFNO|nr:hypothetical protein WN55_11222 [Dufourea novaeangliae]
MVWLGFSFTGRGSPMNSLFRLSVALRFFDRKSVYGLLARTEAATNNGNDKNNKKQVDEPMVRGVWRLGRNNRYMFVRARIDETFDLR